MTVRNQLHFSQHGQHTRDGENAGQNATGGGRHSNRHREPDRILAQRRTRCGRKRIVLRFNDFTQRQIAGNRKTHQGINHYAGRDGNNDRPPHIPFGVDYLGATVGNRGKTLEGQYSQRRRTQKITRCSGFARA